MSDTEHPTIAALNAAYPNDELPYPTGHADAIMGVTVPGIGVPRLIMSVSKILEILISDDDGPEEEGDDKATRAREWFDYNIGGAYIGTNTPIYIEDEDDPVLER